MNSGALRNVGDVRGKGHQKVLDKMIALDLMIFTVSSRAS